MKIQFNTHLEGYVAMPKIMTQDLPESCDIMIVGDVPTAPEVRKGQFLAGPAVTILMDTMRKVGMPVEKLQIHKTTAIKFAYPKRSGKQIPAEVTSFYHKHIVAEINAVKPKMVLILGKTAIQTVYGDPKIKVTSVTGQETPVPGVGDGIICVPLLHPALLARSPAEYKTFFSSMELVSRLYSGKGSYDTGVVQWQVLWTEEDIDRAINFLSATPREVSADIEATGLDYRVAEFLVMGIGFEKNKVIVIPREMRHRIKDFFALKNLRWVWQHGKYDTKLLWRRKLGTVPLHDDAMYLHYVLDETSEHGLEYLSKTFLQAAAYKFKMNQNFKAISLDNYESWFESLCERVAVDCDYTFQLKNVLREKVYAEPALKKLYDEVVMPAAPFLSRVEQNGILIDIGMLQEFDIKYGTLLAGIKEEIVELSAPHWDPQAYMLEMEAKTAPPVFNPAAPKQMSWMVFNKLKLKSRLKKGTSTSAEILEAIDPPHPLINKVLEYRRVAKEQSTYVKGLMKCADVDGRVRTNFSLHITATGRLSSKEPNVQNLPNAFGVGNIRKAIIPQKKFILMDSDYSGAELRWLACLSSCPVLMEVFIKGINLHNNTAKSIWGADYTPQDKMRAKAVNFGIPYGREAPSFVDEFNISMDEAIKMVQGWLDTYHGARDYLQECADAVLQGKYLETPWGRRRRAGLVTPESLHALQNEFRNFRIQSASSDTTLIAAMELESIAAKFNSKITNLVHDSILFEVPSDMNTILEFGYIVNQHMIQVPKRYFGYDVPFASDTDIGFSWGDLAGLNFEKKTVTWEEFEGKKKIEKTEDLQTWLERKEEENAHRYEQEWYKQLQIL